MSYEPTIWKDGELVTAKKLNKLEQGVAQAGGSVKIVRIQSAYDEDKECMVLNASYNDLLSYLGQGYLVYMSEADYSLPGIESGQTTILSKLSKPSDTSETCYAYFMGYTGSASEPISTLNYQGDSMTENMYCID